MAATLVLLRLLVLLPASLALPDVNDLEGEADFRSVRLHWKYAGDVRDLRHFDISYCEDQPWGRYRCRRLLLEEREAKQMMGEPNAKHQEFEAVVKGLRMATNYTLEVLPVLEDDLLSPQHKGQELTIRTKGFSARATQCLANSSVVEVDTGPNFGGKISVEGTEDPRCRTEGDRESGQTSYQLMIDHNLCGSEIHNNTVLTFILVQENLPILTHSTRRFLVMCSYIPETFTVRAGVSLPEEDNYVDDDLASVDQSVLEVDPSELFDSSNNLFDSRLSQELGRALKLSADEANKEPQMWAHLVLMVIMVMAAVVGLSCALWHFVRHARAQNRQGFMSPQEEPRVLEETNSMEAVVRDYGRGEAAPECVSQPVALFQTSFLTQSDGLTEDDLCDLSHDSLHDLDPTSDDLINQCPGDDLRKDIHCDGITSHDLRPVDLCQSLPDALLLDPEFPDETLDLLVHSSLSLGSGPPLDSDLPPNFDPLPFYDNFPGIPEVYHPPGSSLPVLEPLELPHHNIIQIPDALAIQDPGVGVLVEPLSLRPFLEVHLPFCHEERLSLGHSEDEVFQETVEREGGLESCGGGSSHHLSTPKTQRRHVSLDDNWRLGDGEGQIFPAFSQ
ncbi:uncharacterized protein [Panulirus ornatus]|uniref:uncharacterized protein isoform X2 n=1 Tax=Panulirus ornatus TaxID=150431 RepID=UPI003A875174